MRRWCMREERGNMQQEVETQEETKTMRMKGKAEEMNEARGGVQGRNKRGKGDAEMAAWVKIEWAKEGEGYCELERE